MKIKVFLLGIVLCLSSHLISAQNPFGFTDQPVKEQKVSMRFGIAAGGNFSGLLGNAATDMTFGLKPGLNAGALFQFRFLPRDNRSRADTGLLAIQPEIRFSMLGGQSSEDNVTLDMNYVTIPVMFQVYPAKSFYVEAGPVIGLNIGNSPEVFTLGLKNYNLKGFRGNDILLAAGLGYAFDFGLSIGIRYNFGLLLMDKDVLPVHNHCIQAGVAYSFRLGGSHATDIAF